MASTSIHSESFLLGKHLVLANRLLLRKDVSGGLRRRTRFHRLPILLLHTPFLHPRTHSLPLSHSLLLSPPSLLPLRRFRVSPLPPPLFSMTTASPPPSGSDSDPIKTDRVVIKGRVQGVFYRDWTVQNASELGLKGWVRNRRDGSVEALFSGPPDKVHEMEQRCRSGPPAAMVTGFQVFPCSDDPGAGFERRSTV